MRRLIFLVVLTLLVPTFAQTASANELAIWEKLQGSNPKGYVLLLRHSLAPGSGDPVNFRLGDCSTQRNLSEEGRQDARDIGAWIARREIPIRSVESSRWCRAKQTAELLGLGRVISNKNLDSLFQDVDPINSKQTANIRKKIVNHRQKTGLIVLVGHFVNVTALTGVGLDSGKGVLVRANARGELKIMGYSPTP